MQVAPCPTLSLPALKIRYKRLMERRAVLLLTAELPHMKGYGSVIAMQVSHLEHEIRDVLLDIQSEEQSQNTLEVSF